MDYSLLKITHNNNNNYNEQGLINEASSWHRLPLSSLLPCCRRHGNGVLMRPRINQIFSFPGVGPAHLSEHTSPFVIFDSV